MCVCCLISPWTRNISYLLHKPRQVHQGKREHQLADRQHVSCLNRNLGRHFCCLKFHERKSITIFLLKIPWNPHCSWWNHYFPVANVWGVQTFFAAGIRGRPLEVEGPCTCHRSGRPQPRLCLKDGNSWWGLFKATWKAGDLEVSSSSWGYPHMDSL